MGNKRISPRFASPTQDFDLDMLVRRLRKGFVRSVGRAAALHLIVAGINPFKEAEQKAPRPLTTKFIKRLPRRTKPLELRKIPQPKRQLARREVQLAKARMDQVQATASCNTRRLIASHGGGSGISLSGQANFSAMSSMNLEPKLAAASVTRTRASEPSAPSTSTTRAPERPTARPASDLGAAAAIVSATRAALQPNWAMVPGSISTMISSSIRPNRRTCLIPGVPCIRSRRSSA